MRFLECWDFRKEAWLMIFLELGHHRVPDHMALHNLPKRCILSNLHKFTVANTDPTPQRSLRTLFSIDCHLSLPGSETANGQERVRHLPEEQANQGSPTKKTPTSSALNSRLVALRRPCRQNLDPYRLCRHMRTLGNPQPREFCIEFRISEGRNDEAQRVLMRYAPRMILGLPTSRLEVCQLFVRPVGIRPKAFCRVLRRLR